MNKISPLDIRIAVVAYPLVSKDEIGTTSFVQKPISPFSGDERIISLFQNSPKTRIEPSKSRIPSILRKGQFAIIRLFEVLQSFLEIKAPSTILSEIVPPRKLLVPQLPHPRFQTPKPPRFFWHPAYTPPNDEYAPSCLMSEEKEDLPSIVYNSSSICTYARSSLAQKGILRQDHAGFVYLELSDDFITELFPLIKDEGSETVPLYLLEPSPAHIPVILPHEAAQRRGWGEIQDLDTSFTFKIKNLCSLKPKRWPGVEKVYFLSIGSSELEKFRERCMLPSRIRGHEFHVAIAYKRESIPSQSTARKETYRLNVSCFAA